MQKDISKNDIRYLERESSAISQAVLNATQKLQRIDREIEEFKAGVEGGRVETEISETDEERQGSNKPNQCVKRAIGLKADRLRRGLEVTSMRSNSQHVINMTIVNQARTTTRSESLYQQIQDSFEERQREHANSAIDPALMTPLFAATQPATIYK